MRFETIEDIARNAQSKTPAAVEVKFDMPDGTTMTVTVRPDQLRRSTKSTLPGPAVLHPNSPEAYVMYLFGEAYGKGYLIRLLKDDPQFDVKADALRKSGRRFDKNACDGGGWVRK